MAVDEATLNDLLGTFVTDLGGAFHAINAVIGDRLGLYAGLEMIGPATPAVATVTTTPTTTTAATIATSRHPHIPVGSLKATGLQWT